MNGRIAKKIRKYSRRDWFEEALATLQSFAIRLGYYMEALIG